MNRAFLSVSAGIMLMMSFAFATAIVEQEMTCGGGVADPVMVVKTGEQKLLWIICCADSDAILYHYDADMLFGHDRPAGYFCL
jgi:hypothetical protein